MSHLSGKIGMSIAPTTNSGLRSGPAAEDELAVLDTVEVCEVPESGVAWLMPRDSRNRAYRLGRKPGPREIMNTVSWTLRGGIEMEYLQMRLSIEDDHHA